MSPRDHTEKKRNILLKDLLQSLAFHCFFVLLLMNMSSFPVRMNKPIVIDLRLEDSIAHSKKSSMAASPNVHLTQNAKGQKAVDELQTTESLPDQEKRQREQSAVSVPTYGNSIPERIGIYSQMNTDNVSKTLESSDGTRFSQDGGREVTRKGMDVAIGDESVYEGSTGSPLYLKVHFAYIKALIQRCAVYPILARKMGWEGRVTISFVISLNGNVRDIKIHKSSGKELLDKSAVSAVLMASPFPKPPVEAQLIIPVSYKFE